MISLPRFDLQKEPTRGLWLGLAFFALLAALMILGGALPWLPRLTRPPPPENPAVQRLLDQHTLPPSMEETVRRHRPAARKTQIDFWKSLSWAASGILIITGTVVPIARELRRRHPPQK